MAEDPTAANEMLRVDVETVQTHYRKRPKEDQKEDNQLE